MSAWKIEDRRLLYEQMVEQYHEDIFRMIYRRIRTNQASASRLDAEDLTQDVFMQALKSLSSLKDPNRCKAWLFRIALNRVRDFHRKRRLMRLLGLDSVRNDSDKRDDVSLPGGLSHVADTAEGASAENALDTLLRNEFWLRLEHFMKALSHSEHEVFQMKYLDHLNIREIAELLKKSESTVKTHLYRALEKIRRDPLAQELIQGETV